MPASTTTDHIHPQDLRLPAEPQVISVSVREFIDSVDDPALRVEVIVRGRQDRDWKWDELKPIQDAIFHYYRERGDTRFPYVRFATLTEL